MRHDVRDPFLAFDEEDDDGCPGDLSDRYTPSGARALVADGQRNTSVYKSARCRAPVR
jgi:hypothetical protein